MRQVFLDTETTGLSPEDGDRIIEIGCVEMVNRRLSGRDLHFYLNPERASHGDALKVHGLTEEFLADKPRFADVADRLIEYLEGAELIIHNAGFDVAFLDAELRCAGRPPVAGFAARVIDNLALARELYPGKANSLDALCRRLEVDNSARTLHGALLDASLLAEVYLRMTRGQEALVIDAAHDPHHGEHYLEVDLSTFALVLHRASEEEAAEHAAIVADIEQACGGRTLWRMA
jgi:DNA polymerase-3 subunit epsilon